MNNFEFYSPTKVIFGKETEKQVGQEIKNWGAKKVLLHYGGKSAIESGLMSRVEVALKEAGVEYVSLGGVKPNPRLSLVREGIALCQKEKVDFILAVGGGSVIDSSKAIALGLANPEMDIWDYYLRKKDPVGCYPVGVILTLSAAGSETSNSSVITNEEGNIKRGRPSDLTRPKFAIMNPELTYSVPSYQLCCGIVDIMMHTMERYFSPSEGNELTDEIAEGLLRNVIKNGREAVKTPQAYKPLSEIMWAGSLSHNSLTGLGAEMDFATHQLGHELSGMFDVAHGASLSAMWGSWARYVYKQKPARFAQYATKVWGLTGQDEEVLALAGITATESYFKELEMPVQLQELLGECQGEETLKELAHKCSFQGKRTIGSFMKLDEKAIYAIYKAANVNF
ncbi:NADH-dependent alcohol dehydrogenase [Sporanaerobium hydrogeniformans]|uniref:NADH-dependent alcohol dehydrogenase n=1 Tax=Sporanaerobium hydrogeniformans TaxID=3072179 RepID=A0AC61DGI2_9FIRM|nr:iron-containing alcohol dehydrogenase [Sporanaerobium hydrogeniformans]PHV72465.1 NADH-dependent alcohol dehydrogenase [Sporanaerobium hydrogeniformans]